MEVPERVSGEVVDEIPERFRKILERFWSEVSRKFGASFRRSSGTKFRRAAGASF